jgi:hypothetical protein
VQLGTRKAEGPEGAGWRSSDTVQAASAETKKTMTAQDMFDGSQWTLPPPPPPPPWEYHYADSDGNYILDSDGNAVNVRPEVSPSILG